MNENISFTDYVSGIQLPYCSKLSINWKNDNDLTIFRNDIIVILWRSFVSLVKFSYWSKFPFNITTGSGFMTIFSFQFSSMSSKSGNRNNPVWVLPNIWRLTRVIRYPIWQECLSQNVTEWCKVLGLHFLPLLRY